MRYRLQRHDGTDCSATMVPITVLRMVPIQRYRHNWYPALEKPSCTPPDIAFPIAWSFIYLCMGISIGLIWHMWTIRRQMIIRLFGFQLLFNFTWSIFFFYLRSPLLGFANILVLDVLVVYYMIESYPVKKSSAYLFVPYLLWLILATYLNGYILMYN